MKTADIYPLHRIDALFKQTSDSRFLLVEAPAGWGKTTLCSAWVAELATDASSQIVWFDQKDHEQVRKALLGKSLDVPGGSWIFIDDFHAFSTVEQDQIVQTYKAKANAGRLILIRRPHAHAPSFASLRINGEMNVIGQDDLGWTQSEITGYLKSSKAVSSYILDLTDGWPAAMPFFKAQRIGAQSRAQDLTHVDLELFWTLIREDVLAPIQIDDLVPILKLSLMENFHFEDARKLLSLSSDELMSVIRSLSTVWVGAPKTGALLSAVRYVLSSQGWERFPRFMEESHLEFSEYYWEKGDLVTSLTHAAKSGKTDHVCALIEDAGGLYLWLNEGLERMREVMGFTDDSVIASFPRLLLIKSLLHVKEGRLTQANEAWTAARELSNGFTKAREGGDLSALKEESAMMSSLLAGYGCHSLEEQVALSHPKLLVPEVGTNSDIKEGYIHTVICLHNLQNGSFEAAREHATLSENAFENVGSNYGVLYLNFHRGGAAYAEGNSDHASDLYMRAETGRRKYFSEDAGLKFIVNVFASEIELEKASFLSAKRKLAGLKRKLNDSEAWFDVYAASLRSNCYLTFLEKGYEEAGSVTYELGTIAKQKGLKRVERYADSLRLELACRSNDSKERDRLSRKLQLGRTLNDPDVQKYVMWREYVSMVVTHSLVLKATGEVETACHHLKKLYEFGRKTGNKVCELYGLSELVPYDHGLADSLHRVMKETGYVLPMALSRELQLFSQKSQPFSLIYKKVEDASSKLLPIKPRGFTLRETEVIRLLAIGKTDKEIAIDLDVSVHTVRFHLKNIFKKTGTSDRISALQSANSILKTL